MTNTELKSRIYTALNDTLKDIHKELGISYNEDVQLDRVLGMDFHTSDIAEIFAMIIRANTVEED